MDINKFIDKWNVEIIPDGIRLLVLCPKEPSTEMKKELLNVLPSEALFEFKVSPKLSTMHTISKLVLDPHEGSAILDSRQSRAQKLVLKIDGSGPIMDMRHSTWSNVLRTIKNDGYWDKYEIILNGKPAFSYDLKIAEELNRNNHVRETVISNDDITNLKISMESCSTIDDFLKTL